MQFLSVIPMSVTDGTVDPMESAKVWWVFSFLILQVISWPIGVFNLYQLCSILSIENLSFLNSNCCGPNLSLVARKRYLIDEIEVVSWLFWEFFHARWKILFLHGGEDARWECQSCLTCCMRQLCAVEGTQSHLASIQGENAKLSCMLCEVTLCGGGDTSQSRTP